MSITSEGPTQTTNTSATTNTQAQQSLPDWFLNEWQGLLGQGNALNTSLATPVAGLMPDQEHASWLTNAALQEFMNRQRIPAYDVFGMGQNWDQGAIPVAQATPASGAMGGMASASLADPASATAAQLAPKDIAPFMNPFIDRRSIRRMQRLTQQQKRCRQVSVPMRRPLGCSAAVEKQLHVHWPTETTGTLRPRPSAT